MAASGSAFSQTLQSITTTKLRELSKKRAVFEDRKNSLLLEIQPETDGKERARKLVDGVKKCFGVASDSRGRTVTNSISDRSLAIKLKNFERFLQQALYDPSLSSKLLHDWQQTFIQQLNVQSLKYQYATLYGEMVTEWLSAEQAPPVTADDVSEESEVFEKAARKEKVDQRMEWESYVFQPFETDRKAVEKYLHYLFGNGTNKEVLQALQTLRESVERFEESLAVPGQFNEHVLKWVINGLLDSDLLNNDKRVALQDFLDNSVILSEVADVLNMRMGALEIWEWEGEVPIDQRRHVNGKYGVYMHEDLLQAIFLQYIGVKWSVFFKEAFLAFYKADGAWISLFKPIPKLDKKRREYFLGSQNQDDSVQSKRRSLFEFFFLSKLLDSEIQKVSVEDGAVEAAAYRVAPAASMAPAPSKLQKKRAVGMGAPVIEESYRRNELCERTALLDEDFDLDLDSGGPHTKKDPIKIKQLLLHLLSTEILLNTQFHGEITCLRSEFRNWKQSLPHSTIFMMLSFFGVSNKWLKFFLMFLQAPLKFIQDEPAVESRTRKRGVPESHILSDVFGELVLFCLDYSFNQITEGEQLYRMHDEFWFWSSSHEKCVKAWITIKHFASTMGVSINLDNTGSERILQDKEVFPTIDPALPEGEIRWGFLFLDPKLGHFTIDQSMVETHIHELQEQLAAKKSIFAWVQTWNTYAGTFFTTNFGKPANCYGQTHIDMILSTLSRIQNVIFNQPGGVAEHIKATIRIRFGIDDIPDGYLYFPALLGGLELHNSFIPFLQIRDVVSESPAASLAVDFLEAEQAAYRRGKSSYESEEFIPYCDSDPGWEPKDKEAFMSFEEFSRYREDFGADYTNNLRSVFDKLMESPGEESVEFTSREQAILAEMAENGGEEGIKRYWWDMTPYWRWVTLLYGPDIVNRFGGLEVVDRGLLPIGMVGLFRSGRVSWQG